MGTYFSDLVVAARVSPTVQNDVHTLFESPHVVGDVAGVHRRCLICESPLTRTDTDAALMLDFRDLIMVGGARPWGQIPS